MQSAQHQTADKVSGKLLNIVKNLAAKEPGIPAESYQIKPELNYIYQVPPN